MNKERIIQMLKDNPIKTIKCGDIEIPVEYLKQTTVNVNGDDYIRLQQENKILKENAENNDKVVELLKEENEHLRIQISARENVCDRLAGNWNLLKRYCYEAGNNVLDKMQELEQGSDSNVKD